MRLDKISIRWKICFFFVLFSAVMLMLLWLFQTVFLESFYKGIKTRNIQSCAQSIVDNINNSELQSLVDEIAQQNDICVRIVNSKYQDLYSAEVAPDCIIHRLPAMMLYQFYHKALENEDTVLEITSKMTLLEELFPKNTEKTPPFSDGHFQGDPPPADKARSQSMIYGRVVTRSNGAQVMVLLNSTITPVNSTVETLRIQLVIVTGILLALSVALSLLISRKISRPIIKINDSAKELAKGKYDTRFEAKGYREIGELNDTLNFAAGELSKVEQLRRELIANISHDLRTPLTMITGYSEMMRDIPGENTPENVQIIIDEANHLSNLVTDLLDLSKLQSGTQSLSLEDFNLTASIRNILKRYSKLTRQDGYHIRFESEMDVYVRADEIKISQVVYNLINNAINYAGADKAVTLRQRVLEAAVRVEVTDNGGGIDPELLPYIWDRYYKVDKAHRREVVGTGLGLSIVKTVLELHGANYGVISEKGAGSTFWFELKTLQF